MVCLPQQLYTVAQTRLLDRLTIDRHAIGGYTLMCRAAVACFRTLRAMWPEARRVTVLCGAGNNAGDGYVIASLALEAGLRVSVLALSEPQKLRGDAAQARADFVGEVKPWSGRLPVTDVLVDALLGTGLARPVSDRYRQAILAVNRQRAPVLAVDVPSGLSADTGAILGCAVRATATVTFIGVKRGLVTAAARDCVGTLVFDNLDVPDAVYDEVTSTCQLADERLLKNLGRRVRDSHKGSYGKLLVVGGDHGMPGAVCLTGVAALRSGAGLVRVATRRDHAVWLPLARPELMASAVEDAAALEALIAAAKVVAIGPGLGRSDWSQTLLRSTLESNRKIVVDADGLNLLAESPLRRKNWILTPHPAEAARLLGCDAATVQLDRYAAAREIAERYDAVCVLKGAGTVVADTARWAVCPLGNPGMATAGMGDVLTGVIGALWVQGGDPFAAAIQGVVAHAMAGDRAARNGERGLVAGDVIEALPSVLNPCR